MLLHINKSLPDTVSGLRHQLILWLNIHPVFHSSSTSSYLAPFPTAPLSSLHLPQHHNPGEC